MQVTPSDIDQTTQVLLDLGHHGWSGLYFVNDGKITELDISGVFSDATSDLLRVCEAIVENTSVRIALWSEPGGCSLEVKADAKQQHTMILSVHELEGQGADAQTGTLVLEMRITRRRLMGMFMAELWKHHMFLSDSAYQTARDGFPHRQLVEVNDAWNESPIGPSFLR